MFLRVNASSGKVAEHTICAGVGIQYPNLSKGSIYLHPTSYIPCCKRSLRNAYEEENTYASIKGGFTFNL